MPEKASQRIITRPNNFPSATHRSLEGQKRKRDAKKQKKAFATWIFTKFAQPSQMRYLPRGENNNAGRAGKAFELARRMEIPADGTASNWEELRDTLEEKRAIQPSFSQQTWYCRNMVDGVWNWIRIDTPGQEPRSPPESSRRQGTPEEAPRPTLGCRTREVYLR